MHKRRKEVFTAQVTVGAIVGALLAMAFYLFLCSRAAWWLIKLLTAWVPLEKNYPLDGFQEEGPWAPAAPSYGSAKAG